MDFFTNIIPFAWKIQCKIQCVLVWEWYRFVSFSSILLLIFLLNICLLSLSLEWIVKIVCLIYIEICFLKLTMHCSFIFTVTGWREVFYLSIGEWIAIVWVAIMTAFWSAMTAFTFYMVELSSLSEGALGLFFDIRPLDYSENCMCRSIR